jgi:chromosome segregation ATPase
MTTDWLTHPVTLGFYAGLVPAAIFRVQLYLSRRDLQKSKDSQFAQLKTLTDAFQKLQEDLKGASAEKENLRVKIQSLLQSPDKQRLKLLEVLNRAEQRLTLSAPGFAPAWQNAKNEALAEIEQEERGRSAPKQVLHQLMNTGSAFLDRLRSGNAVSDTKSTQPQAPAQAGPEGGPLP